MKQNTMQTTFDLWSSKLLLAEFRSSTTNPKNYSLTVINQEPVSTKQKKKSHWRTAKRPI